MKGRAKSSAYVRALSRAPNAGVRAVNGVKFGALDRSVGLSLVNVIKICIQTLLSRHTVGSYDTRLG